MSMTVTTEYIGKEQAALYLQCNREPEVGVKGTNRRSGPTLIERYKTEMLEGRWKLNPHGLVFDAEGWLLDGAHRMKAVVAAAQINPDIVVAFRVTRGADPSVQLVMDQGSKRAPGDFLVMNGFKDNRTMAAVVKLVLTYDGMYGDIDVFSTWRNATVAPIVLVEWVEKNPEIMEVVRHGRQAARVMKPSAIASGLFLTQRDRPDLDSFTFFEQVMSGVRLESHDPAYRLREHVSRQHQVHRSYETHEELALYIKAYNWWAQDMPAKQVLSFSRVDNFPRIVKAPKG